MRLAIDRIFPAIVVEVTNQDHSGTKRAVLKAKGAKILKGKGTYGIKARVITNP